MGSRPAVGSSYNMISELSLSSSGLEVIARAMLTLFLIPPESSAGYLSSIPASPTRARLCETNSLIRIELRLLCSYKLNPTFSATDNESNNAAC
mmetsp:Transcript_44717/g.72793  ORF Transcript_44717/g.72793 Transcript_44717/m.72793 type:complete len:94 (+) Transcript_44717:521-802(+)